MRRHALLLGALLCLPFPAPAGEEAADPAAAKPEDLVAGVWCGYHAAGGAVNRHWIQVRKWQKQGDVHVFVGTGLVWFGLTDKEILDCTRGRPITKGRVARSRATAQDFTITLKGQELCFQATRVRKIFGGGKYLPDKFTGKLVAPGVLCGEATTEHAGHETFHFIREELLAKPLPLELEKGKTHKVTPLHGGDYHYSLYVPKDYDPEKAAPLLLNFSPGGGAPPLSPKKAEEHGWLMAGLTESRNGPMQPPAENLAAALFDLRRRLNVDTERLYFSGFSGGARMASFVAHTFAGQCPGIICMGAGYYPGNKGRLPPECAVFFIVGKTDSNHGEVTGLFAREKSCRKAEMIIHPGGHSWGRKEDQAAAIDWLVENAPPKAP
jgi:predicted esterase